jgi:ABC-2 type transport system permease protein
MSKIGIIIGHEYKTRVMKKSFIILTFLTPVLLALIALAPTLIMLMGDSTKKNIYVIDNTELYSNVLQSNDNYAFIFVNESLEEVKLQAKDNDDFSALLLISSDLTVNPKGVAIYSEKQVDMETKQYIANLLDEDTENRKILSYDIPNLKEMVEKAKSDIDIQTIKWTDTGEDKKGSSEMALVFGMISTFLIYFFIMMYGGQVMSGVVQEKTNRIVEVIVSSVKPFELMMGKIIAVALVGLTQILMWLILAGILIGVVFFFISPELFNADAMQQMQAIDNQSLSMTQETIASLLSFNIVEILVCLVVYFLGGYLLYASLFAAVGAAVDSETDTQQFMMPITLPIILAFLLGFYASQHPDAALSFWASMFPFTSPVVMMARLPFGVPLWQIFVSVGILILTFIGTTWLAGKIYRTGILMYGKKVTWQEMWKWIKY